jgi:predicted nucleic acid-binding protein
MIAFVDTSALSGLLDRDDDNHESARKTWNAILDSRALLVTSKYALVEKCALVSLLAAGRKKLSLVDCVSFGIMREAGIRKAFAFDRHFTEQGFETRF